MLTVTAVCQMMRLTLYILVHPQVQPSQSQSVYYCKGKGLQQQAEVAQGVPSRLRPRIFFTFGTTRVVGCLPYAPAAFIPGEISLVLIFRG